MSFLAYETYRASGVEWLGQVPEHWGVATLRQVTAQIQTGPFGSQLHADEYIENGVPVLNPSNIHSGSLIANLTSTVDSATAQRLRQFQLKPGDIVFGRRGEMGRCAVASPQHEGWLCGTGSLIVRVSEWALPSYMAAYFGTPGVRESLMLASVGATMDNLSELILARLHVPLPSIQEQSAIVAFLGRETAKIDALVGEQRRLIELLKEKRQAVIYHAVNKGFDPNAPMKDSGVEWQGQVPEPWGISPIRKVARLESGHTPSRSRPEWWVDCTIPWFSLSDVWQIRSGIQEYVTNTAEQVSELGLANSSARLLPKGTVILSRTASVGYSAIMGVDMATTQDFANWVCGPKLVPEFLLYCLRGMAGEFERLRMGSTHNTIYMPDIASLTIAVPPYDDQLAVVAYIRLEIGKLDALVSEAEAAVALLKERRTALISAAVTGKIDVRRAAPNVAPIARLDRGRVRMVVAAEIIERLSSKPTLGRVKLQKLVYLAEAYANVNELQGNYLREAAGPLDRDMIEEMETKLQSEGVVSVKQAGGRGTAVTYQVERRGTYRQEAAELLGSRAAGLTRLIDVLGDLDTKSVEAIATLYAVWNDALLDGAAPTDDLIISAFLNNWHPEKPEKFKPAELQIWLDWMRRHELVPKGTGARTTTGRLFA